MGKTFAKKPCRIDNKDRQMKLTTVRSITLVEILITTLILTFVVGGIYAAYLTGNRSWDFYNSSTSLQSELRRALPAMVRELREASDILITEEPNQTTLNFTRYPVGAVKYQWTNTGPQAFQIVRKTNTSERILGRNISRMSVHYDINTVNISLSATDPKTTSNTYSLKGKTVLRAKLEIMK